MSETRKLTTIVAADVVGYSRLAATDEERTVARLRALRGDLIDPAITAHHGRIVKRTGDGTLMEFRSVVDAVRCAIEVQNGMIERNAGLPPERQILFRIGIHLGDVIEEADGDLMGDGVNIAARLESICEPGAICISEDAYRQVKSRLDLAVSDLGAKDLKNIPEPVHVYSLEVGKPAQAKPTVTVAPAAASPMPKKRSMLVPMLAGIAALVVIVGAGVWYFLMRPAANLVATAPAHLSIVVLPFANLSGDPGQDYLADVLTDELTTDLARIKGSFVIARNTAFTYKGKAVDAKEIGKDLGVRYMLEGSVQPAGDEVRVNAQLIDTQTGAHVWADQFDAAHIDLLQMQDTIVTHLGRALEIQLVDIDAAKIKRARVANPGSEDLALRCESAVRAGGYVGEAANAGFRDCEQALAADPANVRALTWLSTKYWIPVLFGLSHDSASDISQADALVTRALAADPNYSLAHVAKAYVLLVQRRFDGAIAEANQALSLDPVDMDAYAALADAQSDVAQWYKAIAYYEKAIQLSPHDPSLTFWSYGIGRAYLGLKQDKRAVEWERRAVAAGPTYVWGHNFLIAALALNGDVTEAKGTLRQYMASPISAGLRTIAAVKASAPSNDPRFLAMHARVYEGLRLAGMPEDEGPRLSIVVLPFATIGDPAQAYIADAITEELTTALSRLRDSFVIARTTAMTYKGKPVDVKQIGKDLGVRYVLEGSAQRGGGRVRVTTQLIDAETGAHLWADQFDQPRAELLDMQDEIVTRLARALDLKLTETDIARTTKNKSGNLDAEDLALRCRSDYDKNAFEPKNWPAALALCQQALKLDEYNVLALGELALGTVTPVNYSASADPADDIRKAEALVSRALALDPDDVVAHWANGEILTALSQYENAIAELERTMSANPSFIEAQSSLCNAYARAFKPERTIECTDRAMRLSPRDPFFAYFILYKAWGVFEQSRYDESIVLLRRFLTMAPNDSAAAGFMVNALSYEVLDGLVADPAANIREAENFASRALAANRNDFFAHDGKGLVLVTQNRLGDAIAEVATVPKIAAFAFTRMPACTAYNLQGDAAKAIECSDDAFRQGPREWWASYFWNFEKGWSLFTENELGQAINLLRLATAAKPDWTYPHAFLAAALGASGKDAEAQERLKRYLAMPGVRLKTLALWRDYWSRWPSDKPAVLDFRKRFLDGLRKAGMPEQ